MNKYLIGALLLMASMSANAVAIKSLAITGGSFSMNTPGDTFNLAAFANNVDMSGGYTGSMPIDVAPESFYYATSIVTFPYSFFMASAVYTAPETYYGSGYSAPSGDWDLSTKLTLDLSSWIWYWKGYPINQGSRSDLAENEICVTTSVTNCSTPIITTIDASGHFTATWDAVAVGVSPLHGQLGHWAIEGIVTVVPIPAAVWLFTSGLMGLLGMARSSKPC